MNEIGLVKKSLKKVGEFFFPSLCFSCDQILSKEEKLLCKNCSQQLFFSMSCSSLKSQRFFTEILVAIDHPSLAALLVRLAKNKSSFYQFLASLMVWQLRNVDSDHFDLIVCESQRNWPYPASAGYHLAKNMAQIYETNFSVISTIGKEELAQKTVLLVEEKRNFDNLDKIGEGLARAGASKVYAISFTRDFPR